MTPTDRAGSCTRAVHAGELDPPLLGGAVPPIVRSSACIVEEGTAYADIRYPRLSNLENQRVAAAKIAALERAEAGVVTASGMAAISTALLAHLRAGEHLLVQAVLYGGTHSLVHTVLAELGISATVIDGRDPASWAAALQPNTRVLLVETIANPLLAVPELDALAAFAADHQLVSMVDNTFATPMLYRPCTRGFTLSLHSATKYLNGHSDLVAGAVVGQAAAVDKVHHRLNLLGGSLDPQAAWLLHRGLKTLPLRMRQQVDTAGRLAAWLEAQPAVARVYYPGLASHPDHERARRLLDGFGAMIALELAGGKAAAQALMRRVALFLPAVSLGGVESLITRPAMSSHAGMSRADREAVGVSEGLVRLSIGIEDEVDLRADLAQGLEGA